MEVVMDKEKDKEKRSEEKIEKREGGFVKRGKFQKDLDPDGIIKALDKEDKGEDTKEKDS